jgi:hypothetical protein
MYFLLHCCDELQIAHPWSCASPTLGANFSEYLPVVLLIINIDFAKEAFTVG